MNRNNNQLECEMQDALNAILVRYRSIDTLVDRMLEKNDKGESIAAEMRMLEDAKKEIMVVETTTKSFRDRYRANNQQASEAVRKLSADSSELLLKTIEKVQTLEDRTRQAQQKLLPGLGVSARVSQMQNAYRSG